MNKDTQMIYQYFEDLKSVIDAFPVPDLEAFLATLREARETKHAIFICGNGGSCGQQLPTWFAISARIPGFRGRIQ